MNESSLIAPISSLQRYLAEANDSILNHQNEEADDCANETPTLHFHNLSEACDNLETQIATNNK